jgi:MFS transporter, DHA1 family, multidrug resistance protein
LISWKQNLIVVWISQFLSVMGLSFAIPYAPFYIQELGVTDPQKLKLCVTLFGAAAPVSIAIFAPIWGAMADRYGRRPMLLRANLGAAVFLALMGAVQSVPALIAIRCLQGVLTGTMTAAQTMVAVQTPDHRKGFALGALSSGVFSGSMIGAFVGGFCADLYGYRNAFLASSLLLLAAAILVVLGTEEAFTPPPPGASGARERFRTALSKLWLLRAVLLLLCLFSFVRRYDNTFLPLLVQQIHGQLEGASRWTGSLLAAAGIAGILSGIVIGHLADRLNPVRIAVFSVLCAAVLMFPQAYVNDLRLLIALRFGMAFFLGGLEPMFHAWLARTTPVQDRGLVFGWSGTVRAVGWVAGPICSGLVAAVLGIRAVFVAGAFIAVLLAAAIPRLVQAARKNAGGR